MRRYQPNCGLYPESSANSDRSLATRPWIDSKPVQARFGDWKPSGSTSTERKAGIRRLDGRTRGILGRQIARSCPSEPGLAHAARSAVSSSESAVHANGPINRRRLAGRRRGDPARRGAGTRSHVALLGSLREISDGHAVDQLTHGLQTATRAERAGADDEVVLAALLHDAGRPLSETGHPEIAAAMLQPYVRPEVVWVDSDRRLRDRRAVVTPHPIALEMAAAAGAMGPRRATSPLRALPDFLVIGAAKSGTTSLFRHLAEHPLVVPPVTKEIRYFAYHSERSLGWYRAHFPTRSTLSRTGRDADGTALRVRHRPPTCLTPPRRNVRPGSYPTPS